MPMNPLPYYEQLFPEWQSWAFMENDLKKYPIPVKMIIGSSETLGNFYYEGFIPKPHELSPRYEIVKKWLIIEKRKSQTIDAGDVMLYSFIWRGKPICYFVGDNGNRRISVCKNIGIDFILAYKNDIIIPDNYNVDIGKIDALINPHRS